MSRKTVWTEDAGSTPKKKPPKKYCRTTNKQNMFAKNTANLAVFFAFIFKVFKWPSPQRTAPTPSTCSTGNIGVSPFPMENWCLHIYKYAIRHFCLTVPLATPVSAIYPLWFTCLHFSVSPYLPSILVPISTSLSHPIFPLSLPLSLSLCSTSSNPYLLLVPASFPLFPSLFSSLFSSPTTTFITPPSSPSPLAQPPFY